MRIAVTGAAGTLGSQVTGLLAEAGHTVVGVCRRAHAVAPGVVHALADYDDPAALRRALDSVDALVLVSSDGQDARVLRHHDNLVAAAVACNVGHVVCLSGVDADIDSPFCYAVTNGLTERALRDSGLPFSIARASLFTEFFLGFLRPARTGGDIRLPIDDETMGLVSRADVGRCLAALAVAEPTGRCHDLTGPEALDIGAIAAAAAGDWNVAVKPVATSPAEYLADLAAQGEDLWWTYAYASMFASIRDRRWSIVTEEVQALTGQPPQSVRDVLRVPQQ